MSETVFTVRRRTVLGALALLLAPRVARRALLVDESDPIVERFVEPGQPLYLLGADRLSVTVNRDQRPIACHRFRADHSMIVVAAVLHRSGRMSVEDDEGCLWPMEIDE